ncbi:phospholipase D family protein [Acinetobacter bohemicus]|uniref:Putative cardiolipin synthase n=1 Tax=Acinetobacter bohemicus TaxID=1435036 RepID=A0A1I6V2M8_9GAMM|nr:phospholipase D family protein [Acinetobacter bohemicus]KAB0651792.1 phospholipase D family protein [Acinetobacter bohemicus]SFT07924.1 putative cardiolipin synthase [Acinetobacter bohemicus]
MLIKPFTHAVMFSLALITLTGCSLPMNQSNKQPPIQIHAEHWLNGSNVDTQMSQGLTAYLALDDAFSSIASRLHLINKAKYNIDLQYYIWENDSIGHLMLAELLKAADRGVKVRLLIDDQNGTKLDATLKQLAAHPNFEIKLFNPYKFRKLRVIDYAFRLKHINHRMHNKLIIADGAIAVTGGRNISREYFDASDNFQFTDMDILFYGTAVQHANDVFHEFWNDNLSYSVPQLLGNGNQEQLAKLRQYYELTALQKDQLKKRIELAEKQINKHLKDRPINWAKAHFIADSPNKIRGEATHNHLIYSQMLNIMGEPKQHLELVSAYFVPTRKGTDYLVNLSKNDVRIRILTNSFLANDVAVVHAFYQKYRLDLLQNGIKLYEFKPYIERNKRTWYEVVTGNVIPAKGKNTSSLHAKFFDIDGIVFIGSFNFDPRSANLNSEVGLVVESDVLQKYISKSLDQYLPQIAYELKLNKQGEIIWLDQHKDGSIVEYKHDPETTKFQRFAMQAVSYLPIEWMM